MQLPETDNIHYQHAFKKGYRMALDGKRQSSIPSDIRRDMQMREFFQMGWEQANEEMLAQKAIQSQPNWRHRAIWFVIMVLGGLATAAHLISNIEAEQQNRYSSLNSNPLPSNTHNPAAAPSHSISQNDAQALSLLSAQQRQDLAATQATAIKPPLPLDPIMPSSIKVDTMVLSQDIEQRQPLNIVQSPIPKYIKELYFYTQIKQAKNQTIYHRWRTDTQILATIKLAIDSDDFRTWSSKKMASGWQGQWYIEVLDSQQNVIARHAFIYGLTSETQQ